MKALLALIAAAVATGCGGMSQQQAEDLAPRLAARYGLACERQGYAWESDPWSRCVFAAYQQEREQAQAANVRAAQEGLRQQREANEAFSRSLQRPAPTNCTTTYSYGRAYTTCQ